ncbi:MAG: ATP-binding protein [Oscillospiraceae bacterium]|jgi:DNA replication protein DnaC|nr:ATP-binding protein [Oscillospiraceae bacterium]
MKLTNCNSDKLLSLKRKASEIHSEISIISSKIIKMILLGNAGELEDLKSKREVLVENLNKILESINLPIDFFDVKYECGKCRDTGKINGRLCECTLALLKKKSYEKFVVNAPKGEFEDFSFDFYSASRNAKAVSEREIMEGIFRFCVDYSKNFSLCSPNLLMAGETGLGKSHLSAAIARSVTQKGFKSVYFSVPNMISMLEKEKFKFNSDSNSEGVINKCDLLILDDLGSEFQSRFSSSAIYNILNSRLIKGVPTIVSTNLRMAELEKFYSGNEPGAMGERIVSRLIGEYKRLGFVGRDIRQQKYNLSKKSSITKI